MNREEVTERAHAVLLSEGRIDIPLRQLGTEIGVSARMLIYYYGSREALLIDVLAFERGRQNDMLSGLADGGSGPIELLRAYFYAMTEDESRSRLRFFFDLVSEAHRKPEAYNDFRKGLIEYWQSTISHFLSIHGFEEVPWDLMSLALATARGALH